MHRYDPNKSPDSSEWIELNEVEQLELVKNYHKHKRIKLPNAEVHAVLHVVVENQIAKGEEMNVATTLDRLLAEGLDRHAAVHAIGSVLISHMHAAMSDDAPSPFNASAYAFDLDQLSAKKWKKR